MLVGGELIPSAFDSGLDRLRHLGSAIQVVKLRQPDRVAEVLGLGDWFIYSRPASEGRNPNEIVEDYDRWRQAMRNHADRWLGHTLANEANHPDGPTPGPGNAWRYRRDILLPALDRILAMGTPPCDLYRPSLVPYYGSAEWAAEMESLSLLPTGHCYQNAGDVGAAVADCLAHAGGKPLKLLVADEVGDTNLGEVGSVRADRIAQQFRMLAEAGIHAAILFPLAGWADASIEYPLYMVRAILAAGSAPAREPEPEPDISGGETVATIDPRILDSFRDLLTAEGGSWQADNEAVLAADGTWVQDVVNEAGVWHVIREWPNLPPPDRGPHLYRDTRFWDPAAVR